MKKRWKEPSIRFFQGHALELLTLQLEQGSSENGAWKPGYGASDLLKPYQVRKQFREELYCHLPLAELAGEAGIHPDLFNECFCQVFRVSVHENGVALRMERARQLLLRSDQLIYQITEAAGYKNATHFTAAFKRNYGETPKEYRKAHARDQSRWPGRSPVKPARTEWHSPCLPNLNFC